MTRFKKTLKEKMNKTQIDASAYSAVGATRINSLGAHTHGFTVQAPSGAFQGINADWIIIDEISANQNQEKETKMYRDERTVEQQARDYLIQSLDQTIAKKTSDAMDDYNIATPRPKTVGELRQWLKDGKVGVHKAYDENDDFEIGRFDRAADFLVFADPKRKKDKPGYDAAEKAIRKDASNVKDVIVVLGPEKGLEALNAFKSKSY